MKQVNINSKYRELVFMFVMLLVILIAINPGCMETVQPEDVNKRTLKAVVYRITDSDSLNLLPIRGSEVTLYDIVDGELIEIKSSVTNESGVAVFEIQTPLIGKLFSITAMFNAESQSHSSVLICRDTVVSFIFSGESVTIDCSNLDISSELIFRDHSASTRLKRNTPVNINKYERCVSINVNNNDGNSVLASIPNIPAPFKLESVSINDIPYKGTFSNIEIPASGKLSLCFSVSTEQIGLFDNMITIPLVCEDGNSSGDFELELIAEVVEPSCDCDDIKNSHTIILEERVEIGETFKFTNYEVFINETACSVEITEVNAVLTDGWKITSPAFPVSLSKGEKLIISGEFTPLQSGLSEAVLNLNINPQGTSNDCPLDIHFEGKGCYNSCPFISIINQIDYKTFGSESFVFDTVSNRSDNRVFVSVNNLKSSASSIYYILNPDSACSESVLTVDIEAQDNYASQYFTVTPSRITLLPGESAQITVQFTSPDVIVFRDIVAARATGTLEDSAFSVIIKIQSGSCTQNIRATSIITDFPVISPIINLRAYQQRTPQKPEPENEVYIFGSGSRTIVKSEDGSNGAYPPIIGDIFIDVDDNLITASPPQEPILNLIHSGIEVKLWQRDYQELEFTKIYALVQEFTNDPSYNTGYSSGPIRDIRVNDVYAFKFDDYTYALFFIRRVDDGTENTSSKQSGIEFRSVYPIYIY